MKQRPWRLTRRERVRMEAVLLALRSQIVRGEVDPWDIHMATRIMGDPDTLWSPKSWRAIRARLSIALRAALRADEDARMESVDLDRENYDVEVVTDAVREWPALRPPQDTHEWTRIDESPKVLRKLRARGLVAWVDFEYPPSGEALVEVRRPIARALWDR